MPIPSKPLEHARPTRTIEDYLLTMYVMERDQGQIVAARLAERLEVAPATVTMTLKRMQRDGWISGSSRGKASGEGLNLTETGRAAASSVIRRHMLTEWLLVKILKVPYLEIHAEAHQLEHAISPQLEQRLEALLDHPQVCPHGNPLPGCEEATRGWRRLDEIPAGETVIIRRIHEFAEDSLDLLRFLYEKGVLPGESVQVLEWLPFNQTLTLVARGQPVTLGALAARSIYAE